MTAFHKPAFVQLDVDLPGSAAPMPALLDALVAAGHDVRSLAWLLPRVEQAGALRTALAAVGEAVPLGQGTRETGDHAGQSFSVSPLIITADRLSDHAGTVAWLELRIAACEALAGVPELTAQARSPSQRWQLAQEYLSLAHACVAAGGDGAMEGLMQAHPLAGPEARIVLTFADMWRDSLLALTAPAPNHPAWPAASAVVWLDDGDPAALSWLHRHAGVRPVLRVRLVTLDAEPEPECTHCGDVCLLEAPDAEAVAHMAAQRVLAWLAREPERPVGVAVVDRLLARRVRSLLEAAHVQVDDRTGWRLSTTRLAGWLDTLLRGWLNRDWTEWLAALEPDHIPLLALPLAHQLRVLWAQRVGGKTLSVEWDTLRAEALTLVNASDDPSARLDVTGLLEAFERMGHQDRTVSAWAADTLELLKRLGAVSRLQEDSAARALLTLLRSLARGGLETFCSGSLFLLVLGSQMESARFRPQDVTSPVRFMPLQSFRLQRFERMLVLGVAKRHFMPSPPGLLPPAVGSELGLSDPWLSRSQSLWALAEALMHASQCALAHQSQSGGQADPLLGWLHALGLTRRQAGLPDWRQDVQREQRTVQRAAPVPLSAGGLPQPSALPVGAIANLAGCPLKFVLGELAGLGDLQPGVPDDRKALLRGLWIHDVLERLWRDVGAPADAVDAADGRQWLPRLEQALSVAWRRLEPRARSLLFQDRLELERNLPALADLFAKRHADGWRVQAQEQKLGAPLQFHPQRPAVQVHGRLDRLERRGVEQGIVDIKTGRVDTLRRQARQWEDHPQLPLYAWMLGSACDSLEYLAVRGERPVYIPLQGDSVDDMVAQVQQRLCHALTELFVNAARAAPLPGKECEHCEHAGTCRSSWWQEEEASVGNSHGGNGMDEVS